MKTQPKPLQEWLKGYNRSAVAREIGVDVTTVSRWYRGAAMPSGLALQALARFLNIDSDAILLTNDTAA